MTETPQPPDGGKPAPGFYPDGSGTSRYWDGNGWTDQTQGARPAPTGATMTGNPKADAKAAKAYAKATRPWYKKKRWIAAIAVLVIIIAVALGGGGGGSDGPEKVSGDSSTSSGGGSDSGDDDDSGESRAGSKSNPIKIGETVKLKGTQYTVESAKTQSDVGGEFANEKANGVYVLVTLTIENKKDETKTFSDSAAKFVATNDKKYSTDQDGTFAAIGDGGETLIFEDMQPDLPKTGLLVFDVPKDLAKGGILEVGDLFGGGEAYIDLGL